jgi:hypothetical protein
MHGRHGDDPAESLQPAIRDPLVHRVSGTPRAAHAVRPQTAKRARPGLVEPEIATGTAFTTAAGGPAHAVPR